LKNLKVMPYFVFKGVRASSPAFTNALEHTPKNYLSEFVSCAWMITCVLYNIVKQPNRLYITNI